MDSDIDDEQAQLLGMTREVEIMGQQPTTLKARLVGSLFAGVIFAAIAAMGAVQPHPHKSSEYLDHADVQLFHDRDDSRPPITFYVYRAQSADAYKLENINAADLAGAMWYLHNEVVVSTPRKYKIDRIKRFKITLKNTEEFWNVHHRNFGAFLAFDAARCTTPICGKIFSQYGFIVGCQVLPTDIAPYLGESITQVNGACTGNYCNAPVWYSLPGPCPLQGMTNDQIDANVGSQEVSKSKSQQCLALQPGGRCDRVTGAPDCTYSYEDAGEILLDELVGIKDYEYFWNGSFTECKTDVKFHKRHGPCIRQQEYDLEVDRGVGCAFWDGKADAVRARQRMDAVRALFKKHYPDLPYDLKEPPCDFDMYYEGELDWPINHTGAASPTRGFSWERAPEWRKSRPKSMTTAPPVSGPSHHYAERDSVAGRETCHKLGCGQRGQHCACNAACHQYNDCCDDYEHGCQEEFRH